MAGLVDELEQGLEAELDDEAGNALPNFSGTGGGGGGLPSFSGGGGGGHYGGAGGGNSSGLSSAAPGKKISPEKPSVGKKRKKEMMEGDMGETTGESIGNTPVKKKKKKPKVDAKDSKNKKDAEDKDADDKKEGEGGDRKEGEDEEEAEEAVEEEEEDEDEKYKEEYRQMEHELLASCSDEEWQRYETMRCSKFNSSTMKQLLASAANVVTQSIDKAILFTVGGVAKIFVGEIVDNARLVRREWGDDETEPLQPRHVREAYRRMSSMGKMPAAPRHRPLFRK